MSDTPKRLIILVTQGLDNERSSVALTIANGAITSGREVLLFLTSASVDLVRKRPWSSPMCPRSSRCAIS